eukprot:2594089-Alexandrium_andersonii.AAC.1
MHTVDRSVFEVPGICEEWPVALEDPLEPLPRPAARPRPPPRRRSVAISAPLSCEDSSAPSRLSKSSSMGARTEESCAFSAFSLKCQAQGGGPERRQCAYNPENGSNTRLKQVPK